TIAGPVQFGAGKDVFQFNGSGTGTEIYNLPGGVMGTGQATYTVSDPGAVAGDESFTLNGNLGGGPGSATFIVTSGLNFAGGLATFVLNGNLTGGAGTNTFSITNPGSASESFTHTGNIVGGNTDMSDTFSIAGK